MFRSLGPHHAPRVAVAALAAVTTLGACDWITDPSVVDVAGVWTRQYRGMPVYLEITTTLQVFTGMGECFRASGELFITPARADGDLFQLRHTPAGRPSLINLRRVEEGLLVGGANSPSSAWVLWAPAAVDPGLLPSCPRGGGADPELSCASLPALEPPAVASGELSADDAVSWDGGPFYDLYALRLASGRRVQIGVSADGFDAVLNLYDDGGTFLTASDDAARLGDSSLRVQLDSGCYRVEVTSFHSGETGSYYLTAN